MKININRTGEIAVSLKYSEEFPGDANLIAEKDGETMLLATIEYDTENIYLFRDGCNKVGLEPILY